MTKEKSHRIAAYCEPDQIVRTVQTSSQYRKSGFSRSGAASAEPLLFWFGFARGYKTEYSGQSSRWPRRM